MAKKYLDDNGLLYFWQKLKALLGDKVDKVSGKGLSTNDYTTAEQTKLSGIETGAEVNQNAFGKVKVGSSTIQADAKVDTLELVAGDNITLTPDTTNDKVTITAATGASAATADPLMDGTAAVGSSAKYAKEDHVHPSDTSRVPTTRKVNGAALSSDVMVCGYGTCSTGYDTTAKVVTLSGYELVTGGLVAVKFDHAVKPNSTLNINSKGAKSIYRRGAAMSITIIPGGTVALFMYTGSVYELLSVEPAVNIVQSTDSTGYYVSIRAERDWADNAYEDAPSGSPPSFTFITSTAIGAASGICPLNSSSKIDTTYLPSYVDDVIEAYPRSNQTELSSTWLAEGSASGTVITPETGKIYILMSDSTSYAANTEFRWSGTTYVKLADGGVSEITNSEIDTIMAS